MQRLCGDKPPEKIALAVSGGGDSMALLWLAADWAKSQPVILSVVTIDHRLRPESNAETLVVKQAAKQLGLAHTTLTWQGWQGEGNLQDAARQARLTLINAWRGDIRHVLMAHTLDDQAETFLMRLRRGSGVDGLSGIAPRRTLGHSLPPQIDETISAGIGSAEWHIIRPLLDISRVALRQYLTTIEADWVEDSSNHDSRYERVRMRQVMPHLDAVGLHPDNLAATAKSLRRAREALTRRALDVARRSVREFDGDVVFERQSLEIVEEETQLRLLAAALCWVSSNHYRPRIGALETTLLAALRGTSGVLHGCLIHVDAEHLWVTREYRAVQHILQRVGDDGLWDDRWQICAPDLEGLDIRALGPDGVRQIGTAWHNRPNYAIIQSKPALFRGNSLISCLSAGVGPAYKQVILPASFTSLLIEH